MRGTLTVRAERGEFVATEQHGLVLGRDSACDIPFTDVRVSRRHATIRLETEGWVFADLASTNGSFVGSARVGRLVVDRPIQLRLGDPITGPVLELLPALARAAPSASRRPPLLPIALTALLAVMAFSLAVLALRSGAGVVTSSPSPAPVTASPSPTQVSRSDVAAMGRRGTVFVQVRDGHGSGIYFGAGQVLTAAHVVSGSGPIDIRFNEQLVGRAQIVKVDRARDLALLTVEGLNAAGAQPLKWGDARALKEGDELVAVGFPIDLPLTVKFGIVSGLLEDQGVAFIQTDASLNPGMSGGPVLNNRGEVVGVNDFGFLKSTLTQGLNFAIASSTARDFFAAAGGR